MPKIFNYKSGTNKDSNTKITGCVNDLWPSIILKFNPNISRGSTYPIPNENMWIYRLLIELQSSSKNQKNPHSQLIWGRFNFQRSIYHNFLLKLGLVWETRIYLTGWQKVLNDLQSKSERLNEL